MHAQENLMSPYVFPDGNPSELLTDSMYRVTSMPCSSQTHLSTNMQGAFPPLSIFWQQISESVHVYMPRDTHHYCYPEAEGCAPSHLGSPKPAVTATGQAASPWPLLIYIPNTGNFGWVLG